MYSNMIKTMNSSFAIKHRLPEHKGYKTFCDKTTIHGFAELYNSYTVFWKLFWLAVCIGACGITAYQVYQATVQYANQHYAITISSVPEDKMFYPSLRLCYWQWYYWVDPDKVAAYGLDKDILLFGFNFLGPIFTERTSFDYISAAQKFNITMATLNLTSFSEFYNFVARKVPINDKDTKNFSTYFDQTDIIFNPITNNVMFCYKVSQSNMKQYFRTYATDKTISFETRDETYSANVSRLVTVAEYTQYIVQWVKNLHVYTLSPNQSLNVTTFAPPITLLLFNNKAKGLEISMDNDEYIVDVRASVFWWMSKKTNECLTGAASLSSNITCQEVCSAVVSTECNCMHMDQAIIIHNDTTDSNICNRDIYFVNNVFDTNTTKYMARHSQRCNTSVLTTFNDTCKQHLCQPACQVWNYEKSVTIKTTSVKLKKYGQKSTTQIFIEYPKGENVIIMTETDAQSWETFVGNVGGILGIWTGASIVSILQIIYLCFFADHEHECIRLCTSCFRKNMVTTTNNAHQPQLPTTGSELPSRAQRSE